MNPLLRNRVTVTGKLSSPRALVFVHGFGTDQSVWKAVAAPFLVDYKVVLLDNVGAGNTAPADFVSHHYLNLERYAQDLVEVVEALALQDAILVGHSVGGMMALLACMKAPDRFSRVALICSSPCYRNTGNYQGGLSYEDINRMYELVMSSYPDWTQAFGMAAMGNPERPELAMQFVESLRKIPADRAITVLCSIFQTDYRHVLPQVSHPALIIQSDRDSVVPLGVADYLHREIPGSTLCVVDAEGHFPHITAADQVVTALQSFLVNP